MFHSPKKTATLGTIAYVAGVKRGRGNLGARERVGLPRALITLPFRTPATQAIGTEESGRCGQEAGVR